jgi:hypothetical protein
LKNPCYFFSKTRGRTSVTGPLVNNALNALSEQNAAKAQEAWKTMHSKADELAAAVQELCRTSSAESVDYASHLVQTAQSNMNAASELISALMSAKSPSDVVTIASAHARNQLDVLTEQNRRLWAVAQRLSAATMKVIR